LEMFALLSSVPPRHRMEKLPGWFRRRQRSLRPAAQVLDELPSGPVVDSGGGREDSAPEGADA
jgi:hypothetical protein